MIPRPMAPPRHPLLRLWLLGIVLGIVPAGLGLVPLRAAPDFRLTATESLAEPKQRPDQALIYRELVRQALVLSALHETGQTPVDEVFDAYDDASREKTPRLLLDTVWRDGSVAVTVGLDADEPPPLLILGLEAGGPPHARADALARALVPALAGQIAPWLRATIPTASPVPRAPALPDARRAELENQPDAFACFELLRHWHGQAAAEATPEAFAGLARAYALLGESSRHQWNAFATACTARALLYSALLDARHPGHPLTLETRAWVTGLAGYHSLSLVALDALASRPTPPAWLPVLDAAVRYQTPRLREIASSASPRAPLAAFLALVTLEAQRTLNLYERHYTELEPRIGPNLRPTLTASDILGVSARHRSTRHARELWWHAFTRRVPETQGLPAALRALSSAAPEQDENQGPSAIRDFALASRAAANDGYPAWGVLGRMLWDSQFVITVERIAFMATFWSVPTEEEVDAALPVFAGHPHQAVLATYRRGQESTFEPASFREVRLGDIVEAMREYTTWAKNKADNFADRSTASACDASAWYATDDAHSRGRGNLLRYEGDTDFGREAPAFLALSPWHPRAFADAILFAPDWETHRQAALEKHPDDPLIVAAIGERLLNDQRAAEAVPLLQRTLTNLGELKYYGFLADAQLAAGDEAAWLATRLAFNQQPDSGLAHARNSTVIARHYLATHRPALALPHAESAAESYASWAMDYASLTHAILGDHRAARRWQERKIERYGGEIEDRVSAHAVIGVGEREALVALLHQDTRRNVFHARDHVVLDLDHEALPLLLAQYDSKGDNYYLLLAALSALELGDRDQTRTLLDRVPREYSGNQRRSITRVANRKLAEAMRRYLDQPTTDADFLSLLKTLVREHRLDKKSNAGYSADFLYFAARFLRLQGRAEAAAVVLASICERPGQPDPNDYVFPLIAREFQAQGTDMLTFFRNPARPASPELPAP